ncbi:acetoin utilization protein AcuC [Anaerosoma tenue]|uniref:acetoin utilization protein AcuC n=1 Tax=Anaerosoma tenue TaxID=2933588 RepID=UPI002260F5CF|nr:acetoin utilization protein AcuC [Anaerosoma tenue]MCK8115487.1 acetoin utilization protein AcuC [Anaerosoma tenue]
MRPVIVYDTLLGAYDLAPWHPLRPERVTLTLDLIAAYGLIATGDDPGPGRFSLLPPRAIDREALALVHDETYIEAVERASIDPDARVGHGIGTGDDPAFAGMHEAATRVVAATCTALDHVLSGVSVRAFAPAGGLHHAHRDRAAGFCIYNDAAVAMVRALSERPDLRIAYIDIDAHHADGVQEAFCNEPRVLVASIHEDGRYLFPGTGSYRERGAGDGLGTTINVPLPPYAGPDGYRLAFDKVVDPLVRSFAPDVIVTQNGADAHWSDPLTSLGMTVPGYEMLFTRLSTLADRVCGGRLVALGGGGYSWLTVVPRVWTLLAASLLRLDLSDEIPAAWQERVRALGGEPPTRLREDPGPDLDDDTVARVEHDTAHVISRIMAG